MPMSLSRARSASEWDSALRGQPGVTAFHRWPWLVLQASLHEWTFEPLVARAGEHVVGAVPLLLARSGPIWLPAPVPFPYIGPVTAPQYLDALLHALRTWSAGRLVALNRLDFLQPASSQLEVLQANGCDLANATTYLVDLPHGDKEALLLSMSRNARKSLRGAQRHGVSVRAAIRKDVDSVLPTLLQEAFAAHGQRNPYPRTVGAAVWDAFAHEDNTYLAGAYIDGRCVGILAAFGDIHGPFAWAGGCLREGNYSAASGRVTGVAS